jgi:hypothetical protein
LLIGGLLDYAPSGKTDHGARFGQVQITEVGERSGDAAGGWIA